MDTRTKILTPADLEGREFPRPLLLATGRFDVLRVEMTREVTAARERTGAQCVVAVVGPVAGELAPLEARAEMAAAIRVIDYVLRIDNGAWEDASALLQPVETIRLEESEESRIQELISRLRQKA